METEPGRMLLHYRLVDKIGEGGMGVVWKALDTNLDREVAIKILPEEFSANPGRLARFEREAKLLASINHPNIATVYGLHEHEGTRFLAMELIDGQDLATRLAGRALPARSVRTPPVEIGNILFQGPAQMTLVEYEEASRAAGSHRRALSEPYVSLSAHTAPSLRPFA